MRSSVRTIAISALAAASVFSFVLLPSAACAADCWGAAADRVSIGPDGARISARVTVPGASHESLVAAGLSVSVVDAEDPGDGGRGLAFVVGGAGALAAPRQFFRGSFWSHDSLYASSC